jgi:hypothetical protein
VTSGTDEGGVHHVCQDGEQTRRRVIIVVHHAMERMKWILRPRKKEEVDIEQARHAPGHGRVSRHDLQERRLCV